MPQDENNNAAPTANSLDGDVFVRVVFHGDRFAGGLIPVEVLPELAAYRTAIVAAAKGLYRARQGRIRVPKGFESSIHLVLAGEIGDGSAVAEIRRVRDVAPGGVLTFPMDDEVDHAVDYIESYLKAVTDDSDFPNSLAEQDQKHVERSLAAMGRYLKADEAIETRTATRTTGALYTKAVRRRLAERTGRQDIEVDYDNVSGEVVSVTAGARNSFRLNLGDLGTDIEVEYDPDRHDPLLLSLPDARPIPVIVSFTALMDVENDRIAAIQDLTNLVVDEDDDETWEPPNDTQFDAAIAELESMTLGWFDGIGLAPVAESLEWARGVLKQACRIANSPLPWLYPTPEGGVRAEWEIGRFRASASFDPEEGLVRLFSTDLDSDTFIEDEVSIADATPERVASVLASA